MSLFTEFKAELISFIKDTYEKSYQDNNITMSKRRSDDVCELLNIIHKARHPAMLKNEILKHMGTMYEQTAFIVRVAFKLGIDSSKLHKGLKHILENERFSDKNLQIDYAIETRDLAEQAIEKSEKYKELQVQHEQLSRTIKDFIEKLQKAEAQVKELENKNKVQAEKIKELETGVTASPESHVLIEVSTRVEDEHKIQELELELTESRKKYCSLIQENRQLTQKNSELMLEKNKLEEDAAKKAQEIGRLNGNNQQLAQKTLTLLKGNQDGKMQSNKMQVEVKHAYTITNTEANKPSFWSKLFGSSNKQPVELDKTHTANLNICFIE